MKLTKFIKNKKNQIMLLKGGLLTIILIATIPIAIIISKESNKKNRIEVIEQNKFLSNMKSRYGNKYFLDSENSLEDWGLTFSQVFKDKDISDIKIKYVEYDFKNKNVKAKIFWKKNNIQKSKAIIVEGFKDPKIKLYNNKKISENEFENIVLPQNFTIPQSVEKIHQTAFAGSVLPKNLKIPTSVKIIENGAFKNVKGKVPLIPHSVTEIGQSIFKGSTLPDNWIHPKAWSKTIPNYSYAWATLHKGFKVPDSVIKIEKYAFHNAKLNNGFKKIHENYFIKKENLNHKNKIIKDLNLTKANQTLVKGVTLSGSEEKDFNNILKKATEAIAKKTTINDINNTKAEWMKKINAKKEALNNAIIQANRNADFLIIQDKAKNEIKKIRISENLEEGINQVPKSKAKFEETVKKANEDISKAKTVEAVNQAKANWIKTLNKKKKELEEIIIKKITVDGTLKRNAKIVGMKIWRTNDYYGVVVPLGTSIERKQIENIFYINKEFQVSFDSKYKNGNQEGTFKVSVDKGKINKFVFKIFVTGKTFNFNKFFNKKELPSDFALPNNVETIKEHEFKETIFNKEFNIPSSVKIIEDGAFASAKNIPLIPNTVTKIGEGVFSKVILPNNWVNPQVWSEKIPARAYMEATLPSDFKLQNTITSIGNFAFEKTENVPSIPDSVTKFGTNVFKGVTIPKNWNNPRGLSETITKGVYAGATFLNDFELQDTVKTIEDGAFASAKNVPLIPDSVEKIEGIAFGGATFISNWKSPKIWNKKIPANAYSEAILPDNFELPNTVRIIDPSAFKNTRNVPPIPNSVIKLEGGYFIGATLSRNWKHPKIWGDTIPQYAYLETTLPIGFIIPESVTRIEKYAFAKAKNIPLIPDSVTTLMGAAFVNTVLPKNWVNPNTWNKTIPYFAYQETTLPKGFIIPESVKKIQQFAFLKAINIPLIPDNVCDLEESVFAESILPENWVNPKAWSEKIPIYAYIATTLPKGFIIPESVKTIEENAFKNAINKPLIPDTVKIVIEPVTKKSDCI